MAAITRKLGPKSGDNVRIEIDLTELFGDELLDRQSVRQSLAQEVIDAIVKKAENFGGKYSDEYSESAEFRAFGKSKSDVNLTLSGQMLSALDVISDNRDKIVIGWEQGSEDGKKAHGNITGKNGQVKTKRDFFKLTESELKAIARQYRDDLTGEERPEGRTVQDILDAINRGARLF